MCGGQAPGLSCGGLLQFIDGFEHGGNELLQLAGELPIRILFGWSGENHGRVGSLGRNAKECLEECRRLAVHFATRVVLRQGEGSGHIEHQFVQKDQDRLIAKGLPQVSTSRNDALFVVLAHLSIAGETASQQRNLAPGGIGANPLAIDLMLLPP